DEERQAVQADDRGRLSKEHICADRHAHVVPREPREQEPPRPFRKTETEGQRKNAQRPRRPEKSREREPEGREQRQSRRQRDDSERERPHETVGVDEASCPYPPEPGDKIAESHPPARAERRAQSGDGRAPIA